MSRSCPCYATPETDGTNVPHVPHVPLPFKIKRALKIERALEIARFIAKGEEEIEEEIDELAFDRRVEWPIELPPDDEADERRLGPR